MSKILLPLFQKKSSITIPFLSQRHLQQNKALLTMFIHGHRSFVEKKTRILSTSEIHLGLVFTRDLKKTDEKTVLKSIMIVTGKGLNSKGKLKLKTPLWLKSEDLSKYVVGFETMPHNKGGEGALFVQLKNRYKYKL